MRPLLVTAVLAAGLVPWPSAAQCPEEPPLQNFTGAGTVVCPCFIPGEQAGAVLTPPAGDYPIEVLRVGIGWGSQFGGAPQSLEQAVHVYAGGLPDPGLPIASLPGPLLTDGFINEFDLEPLPGEIVVSSGPVTVALEFLNQNSGDIFAPSVVHDGNGCQAGKNVVKVIPGGWSDACMLGVTGDWVFQLVYRRVNCGTAVEELAVSSASAVLLGPQPNPFREATSVDFVLERREPVDLSVFDVRGRLVAVLASRTFPAGRHRVGWDGRAEDGTLAPAATYFVKLEAGSVRSSKKIVRVR